MQINAVLTANGTGSQTGKKINTTITYLRNLNDIATKGRNLAIALNQLTTNIFQGASINKIGIASKEVPTLQISTWAGTTTSTATITYSGDGQLFCNCTAAARIDGNAITVNAATFTGEIFATETDNYSSVTLEISR